MFNMKVNESAVSGSENLDNEKPGHAFFSYSRDDKMRILDLSTFLKREELQPWIDNQLKLGDIWQAELKNKIIDCKLFVILMSENSRKSRFVKWEIEQATQLAKPIFAIKLNDYKIFEEFEKVENLKCVPFWDFAKPNWGLAETIRKFLHPDQIPSQKLIRQRLEVICLYLFEELYNIIPDTRFFTGMGSGMKFSVSVDKALSDLTTDKWLLFFRQLDKVFGWKVFIFPNDFKYLQFFPTIEKLIDFMMKHLVWEDIQPIRLNYG